MRTISSKNLSRDSPYLSVSEDVLLGRVKAVAQAQSDPPYLQPQLSQQSLTQVTQLQPGASTVVPAPLPSMLPSSAIPNRQNTVTFREPPSRHVTQNIPPRLVNSTGNSPEMFMNPGERDELSDILEEAEEEAMLDRRSQYYDRLGRPMPPPPRGVLRNPSRPFSQEMPRGAGLRDPFRETDLVVQGRDPYGRTGPIPPLPPSMPVRSFQNMNIGPPPLPFLPDDRGLPSNRFRPGPDMRNMDQNRPDFRGMGPSRRPPRGDFYRGPYEDDYISDRDRFPMEGGHYAMQLRTSSLPQIEITKDDSFESMDSRNRAFSDREEEHAHRGLRSRYNSPPNDPSYRRQRSQSRDRYVEEPVRGRSRPDVGGGYDRDYGEAPRWRESSQSRRELPRDGYRGDGIIRGNGDRNYNDGMDRRKGLPMSTGNTLERKSKMIRVFRANFDYDATISANVDADSEELFFKQGQLIKVSFAHPKYRFIHLCY